MTALLATAALFVVTACSSSDGEASPENPLTATSTPSRSAPADAAPKPSAPPAKGSATVVSTLTEDLKSPWGMAALPEADLLVSSRDEGTITRIDGDSGKKTEVGSVPGVSPAGEGGLLGIAISPSFASDTYVYAYFTTESDNRIARMLYDPKRPVGRQLGAPDTVLRGIPKGTVHNGGRIAFGPDKMLYAGTGESGETDLAQDKKSLGGKILRMTPDGRPVHGNPEADSVVYTQGHRNVQGLAWDSEKRLWASEFGQDTWDELNLIQPGRNYGWPDAEGKAGKSGFVDPVEEWRTKDASPSGIAFAEGSIWMASLRGERLWRIPLAAEKVSAPPQSFLTNEYGRFRTVLPAGDGALWVLTNETDGRGSPEPGDDKILRVEVK